MLNNSPYQGEKRDLRECITHVDGKRQTTHNIQFTKYLHTPATSSKQVADAMLSK